MPEITMPALNTFEKKVLTALKSMGAFDLNSGKKSEDIEKNCSPLSKGNVTSALASLSNKKLVYGKKGEKVTYYSLTENGKKAAESV